MGVPPREPGVDAGRVDSDLDLGGGQRRSSRTIVPETSAKRPTTVRPMTVTLGERVGAGGP